MEFIIIDGKTGNIKKQLQKILKKELNQERKLTNPKHQPSGFNVKLKTIGRYRREKRDAQNSDCKACSKSGD